MLAVEYGGGFPQSWPGLDEHVALQLAAGTE